MSFNRENVIWQSADGTWSRGFFTVDWCGDEDPEWDVDYDMGSFEWASTGHATQEAAARSWDGPNPGGHFTVEAATNPQRAAAYDEMARAHAASSSGTFRGNVGGRAGGMFFALG